MTAQPLTGPIPPFGTAIEPFRQGDRVWYFNACDTRVEAIFQQRLGDHARIIIPHAGRKRGDPDLSIDHVVRLDRLFHVKQGAAPANHQPAEGS